MMRQKDIGQSTKIGIVYSIAARLAGTFGQFIGTIILARLLAPEDFGLVATGILVIGFATRFGNFGFHMGLIQRKEEITGKHVNTLFVMDLSFKVFLWLVIYALTPTIAAYFNNPLLTEVLPIIALYMILECFSATPLTVLKRNMDFKSTSIIGTIVRFVTIITSIGFALLGFKFWSLIYSKIIGISVSAVLAIWQTRWLPKLKFDRQASKELFRFGVMISLRNLFKYGANNVDYFFVSKLLGSRDLGFYEKAFQLMRLPQKRITRSVNRVVFSAFARIQDEPERIRKAFQKLILAISLISYPLLMGMAFIAPLFIPIALGEKWQPTVVPLQIMCLAGILRSMDPFLNSILTATGYVKSTVTRRGFELVLLTGATFYGVKYGIIGVSIAVVASAVIMMVVMMSIIARVTRVKWRDYFGAQFPAIITTLGMLASMYLNTLWLGRVIAPEGVLMLFLQVAVGGITYLGLHLLFRFRAVVALYHELANDTRGALAKLKRKSRGKKQKLAGVATVTPDMGENQP